MATLDKFYNHEPAKDNIIEEAVLIIVDLPQIVHQLKILQDDEKFHYVEKLMKSCFLYHLQGMFLSHQRVLWCSLFSLSPSAEKEIQSTAVIHI